MKVSVNRISPDGIVLQEDVSAGSLDVETGIIYFQGPIRVGALITRITNAVSVEVNIGAVVNAQCSRCLEPVEMPFTRQMRLHYQVTSPDQVIDLSPDIREEIILAHPYKPLCKPECKGLCLGCGKNLNQGDCQCRLI